VRPVARLTECLFIHRDCRRQVDVDANQVHQLEWPHPEAAAGPDDPIDLGVPGDTFSEQAQCLAVERAGDAVDDEPRRVLRNDGRLPQRFRQMDYRCQGLRRSLRRLHDFDQRQDRRRIEKVHTTHALR